MTDYHVHIGQFDTVYYYADRVFSALKANGIDEVWFSSTTSCLYCKEKDLYEGVKEEMKNSLLAASEIGLKAHALYWVVPKIHFTKVVSVKEAMSEIEYDGFKIHPRAQKWDLSDEKTFSLAKEIFSYAQKNDKLILIHCDDDYPPTLFEHLIASHPKVSVQLAHCRPIKESLYMLRTYPNTICDTAMADKVTIEQLKQAEFSSRLHYGTDFPITHYRSKSPMYDPTEKELEEFLKLQCW